MKQVISYAATDEITREEQDVRALKDLRDYLGEERWTLLMELYDVPEEQRTALWAEPSIFESLADMFEMMTGVEGYPVNAFGRKYLLASFRAYMGEDCADEAGWPIKESVH